MTSPDNLVLSQPGTHWRIERADRAALLIDGAAYFSALVHAIDRAERSIVVLGWDFRTDLRLDPERTGETLAQRFARRLDEAPELEIRLLIWDWLLPMSVDREVLPQLRLGADNDRLHFVFDDEIPVGAAHHEKAVVIDDCLAFVGGIDLTEGRWDTPRHDPKNPHRRPADGDEPPLPFHDAMLMVEGPLAQALAEQAADRWESATGQRWRPAAREEGSLWPQWVVPDLQNRSIAIARIRPEYAGRPAVAEVRNLYLAAIARATRVIHIENQYLTVSEIAQALAERLKAEAQLEIVVITPDACEGPFETVVMDAGRLRFVRTLRQAAPERVRVLTAQSDGVSINIHLKAMIVDDRFFTIGSTNLANRSMGVDTETNLAIESETDDPVISGWRHRLLAEHLGTTPDAFAALEDERGSTIAAIDQLNDPGKSRHVAPLKLEEKRLAELLGEYVDFKQMIDPPEPIVREQLLHEFGLPKKRRLWRRRVARVAGLAGIAVMLAGAIDVGNGPPDFVSLWTVAPLSAALLIGWMTGERLWRRGRT